MKNKTNVSIIRLSVLFVLMAALALCLASCGTEKQNSEAVTFTVTVVGPDGTSTEHTVTSDADNLGDALLKEGIIEGNEDQYGLYITAVDGITADFNTDGAYWALYIGEEYAMTGISFTPIAEGDSFKLVYEKNA